MTRKAASMANAVNRFEEATRAHEMRGSQAPEDREAIEKKFALAKKRLIDMIGKYLD